MEKSRIITSKTQRLDQLVRNMQQQGMMAGASYAVITENESYVNTVGLQRIIKGEQPITRETLYDVASVSKVVATTTAIMQLIEDGYITLKTKLADVLPQYHVEDVTIEHLLTHTSGHVPDIRCLEMKDKEELLQAIFASDINREYLGKKVVYSDIGYILLGLLIEKITGSYEEYVTKHIFEPIGMTHTMYHPPKELKDMCAATEYYPKEDILVQGYVHDEKCRLFGGVSGHAGVFTTIDDMVLFVQMMLNMGWTPQGRILNPATIQAMTRLRTKDMGSQRGLGYIIAGSDNEICDLVSEQALYHTGFTGPCILMDFAQKKGFVLLANRIHPSRENMTLCDARYPLCNLAMSCIV